MKKLLFAALLGANLAAAQTPSVAASAQPKDTNTVSTASNVVVIIETSEGNITAELFADKAPISVSNFLGYVDSKFYDGTIFHRVMKNFMIQGGGFTPQMVQKSTRPTIKNEATNGLKNDRGTLAMARRPDPDSATAQFFINHVNNAGLNRPAPDGFGYAVFGKVTEGMDVVDKIASLATGNSGVFQNVPQIPVEIKSIRRKVPLPLKPEAK